MSHCACTHKNFKNQNQIIWEKTQHFSLWLTLEFTEKNNAGKGFLLWNYASEMSVRNVWKYILILRLSPSRTPTQT